MPEGHSVHRIARQFDRNFVGKTLSASSPQGRFAEGASVLDGREAVSVQAVGKQMFLETEGDLWLRVHLGLYGAWDFAGEIIVDPTIARAGHQHARRIVREGLACEGGRACEQRGGGEDPGGVSHGVPVFSPRSPAPPT